MKITNTLSFLALFLFSSAYIYGQDEIKMGTLTGNANVIMDLDATDKGLLIPRLDRGAITTPVNGLLVYDIIDDGMYVYVASLSAWVPLQFGQTTWERVVNEVRNVTGVENVVVNVSSALPALSASQPLAMGDLFELKTGINTQFIVHNDGTIEAENTFTINVPAATDGIFIPLGNITLTSGDISTGGTIIGGTITDGTATMNAGVITGTNLTDGTASMTGGTVTGTTLTDGTATVVGGVVTATNITDGTASMAGGTVTGTNITDGSATMAGGTITGTSLTDGSATMTGGTITGTSVTDGTATMTGGTITGTSLTDGTATITGGTVTGTNITDGSATMAGGTITGTSLTDGSATMTGGTITGTSVTDGTATMTGGTITGTSLTDGTATISGGTVTGTTLTDGSAIISSGNITGTNITSTGVFAGNGGSITGVGGDVGGVNLGSTVVTGLRTIGIAVAPLPATGQALIYNGSEWSPASPADITKLPLAGGTMTGDLDMGVSNDINNVDELFANTINGVTFTDGIASLSGGDFNGIDVTSTGNFIGDGSLITNLDRANISAATANYVVINDGAGLLSEEAYLDLTRGGTGIDNTSVPANTIFSAPDGVAGSASFQTLGMDYLSDVDVTTVAPVAGDLLSFDGTNWVPKTPIILNSASALPSAISLATAAPLQPITGTTLTIPPNEDGDYLLSFTASFSTTAPLLSGVEVYVNGAPLVIPSATYLVDVPAANSFPVSITGLLLSGLAAGDIVEVWASNPGPNPLDIGFINCTVQKQ